MSGLGTNSFFDRQASALANKDRSKRTEPFWRIDEPILDSDGRVSVGGMWDYQRKIWLAPNYLKVLLGGYACLVGDQEVYDPIEGLRRTVSDLGPLNTVSLNTATNKLKINASLAFLAGEKECLKVLCSDGSEVKLSTDHPIYTGRGWVKASDLLLSDLIATPRFVPEGPGISISDDEIAFIAYMMADGSTKNACVFTKDNKAILEDLQSIVSRLGGTSVLDTKVKCPTLRISKLKPLLIKHEINCLSKHKRIPKSWYGMSKKQAALFLSKFLSCDAYIGEGSLDMSLASQGLVKDIRHLLLVLGIKSSVAYKKAKCGDKFYDAWRMCVSADYLKLLNTCSFVGREDKVAKAKIKYNSRKGVNWTDIVPVSRKEVVVVAKANSLSVKKARAFTAATNTSYLSRSKFKLFLDTYKLNTPLSTLAESDVFWTRIESITSIGKHKVYDLSVDDDHNFVCNNVVVHNSGKSNLGCKRIIALALENAPVPVATVSPTFGMARKTVVTQIAEFLHAKQNFYGSSFAWKYNSSVHEFKFRFEGREAEIKVLSGENPMLLKGPNLAAAFMDEPFIQDWEVFEQMNARIRHPDARRKEFILCGTPEMNEWGYDLCSGNLKGFSDVFVVRASTRGNKAIGKDYIERMEGMLSDKAAKVYLDGYFLNLSEGLVYYAFDPEDHVVDIPMPNGAELGCGMDFNVNPMALTVFWRKDDHVHVIDAIELPNADTEYACQVLQEKYWQQGLRNIYPDAAGRQRSTKAPGGRSDFHFIRAAGFKINCRDANPARKDRYNAVNAKFRSKTGRVTLTISPNKQCTNLIKYLSTYSHELMNKQEAMSHLCFAGDTLVDTDKGFVRIDALPAAGRVKTWNGVYTPYINARLIQREAETVCVSLDNGDEVICTPDHKWLTVNGWVQAKDLDGKEVLTCESKLSVLPSKYSTESVSIKDFMMGITESRVSGDICTDTYGSIITGLLKKDSQYITRTKTKIITILKILLKCHNENMQYSIPTKKAERSFFWKSPFQKALKLLRSGIEVKREEIGINFIMVNTKIKYILKKITHALFAQKHLALATTTLSTVQKIAHHKLEDYQGSMTSSYGAQRVKQPSNETNIKKQPFAAASVRVMQVRKNKKEDVYCLTVPEHGCFVLKSGAIVANCDSFSYPIAYLFPVDRESIRVEHIIGV